MNNWIRIPIDIQSENDRRIVLSVLSDNGLEVRVKKDKVGSARIKRFIEYKEMDKEIPDETAITGS